MSAEGKTLRLPNAYFEAVRTGLPEAGTRCGQAFAVHLREDVMSAVGKAA